MYKLNLRDFSSLNTRIVEVGYIPTPSNKVSMVCSYCNSPEHTISSCPNDNELIKIMLCNEEPDFNGLSLNVLKKITWLCGLKTTQPKIQILLQLKRIWMKKHKEREEKIERIEKELAAIKLQATIVDCPICMDTLSLTNVCVTKCGHKYCSTCFVRSVMKKNSCPLCREKIVEEQHYVNECIGVADDYISFDEFIRSELDDYNEDTLEIIFDS